MILERFNTIVFIGDSTAQTIYAALNILLREDLALGGLQQWMMNDQDRAACKCDNQFLSGDCLGYAVKSSEEVKKNRKESPYFCERMPYSFPRTTSPADTFSRSSTCLRPCRQHARFLHSSKCLQRPHIRSPQSLAALSSNPLLQSLSRRHDDDQGS